MPLFFRTHVPEPIKKQLQIQVFAGDERYKIFLVAGLVLGFLAFLVGTGSFIYQSSSAGNKYGWPLMFGGLIADVIFIYLIIKYPSNHANTAEEITALRIQQTLGQLPPTDFQALIKLLYEQARLSLADEERGSLPDLTEAELIKMGSDLHSEIQAAIYTSETTPILRP